MLIHSYSLAWECSTMPGIFGFLVLYLQSVALAIALVLELIRLPLLTSLG